MDTYIAQVGQRYDYRGTIYTVARIMPAGTGGISHAAGPQVVVHTRPGGHSLTVTNGGYPDPSAFTEMRCLDRPRHPEDDECQGSVEWRESLSGTGTAILRCDHHWDKRLDLQQEIEQRYPVHQPSDFDPGYAGEHWGDDY